MGLEVLGGCAVAQRPWRTPSSQERPSKRSDGRLISSPLPHTTISSPQPQKRPSINDILATPFMKARIQKFLSTTLQAGGRGAGCVGPRNGGI